MRDPHLHKGVAEICQYVIRVQPSLGVCLPVDGGLPAYKSRGYPSIHAHSIMIVCLTQRHTHRETHRHTHTERRTEHAETRRHRHRHRHRDTRTHTHTHAPTYTDTHKTHAHTQALCIVNHHKSMPPQAIACMVLNSIDKGLTLEPVFFFCFFVSCICTNQFILDLVLGSNCVFVVHRRTEQGLSDWWFQRKRNHGPVVCCLNLHLGAPVFLP